MQPQTAIQTKAFHGEVAPIQDAPICARSLAEASRREDFPEKHLVVILKNRNRRIMNLPKTQATDAYLLGEVLKIARAFGASQQVPADVQAQCVKILQEQFSKMSVPEVWLAYRLHSVGELPDTKGKAEMYGGNFNARNFAAVLAAWKEYKSRAVAEYKNEEERIRRKAEEDERAERMKEQFWPNLVATVEKLRADGSTDWRDCPAYICDSLRNAGKLSLRASEWKPIWEDALELARIEIAGEKEDVRGKVRLIGDVAKRADEEAIDNRAKVIAKKLTVFRLVVLKKDFKL